MVKGYVVKGRLGTPALKLIEMLLELLIVLANVIA